MINNFGESYFRYYEKMFYGFQRKALAHEERSFLRKMRVAYQNCETCLRYLTGTYDSSHLDSLSRMKDEMKRSRREYQTTTDAQALRYAFAVCLLKNE